MSVNLTPEDLAILIRAWKISNIQNIPKFANVTTICRDVGVSRKTGYQWANKMEKKLIEREIKSYDFRDNNDPSERPEAVKTGKGRKLSPELKLRLYEEFVKSSNKTDLARKWGLDRSYIYEIARECQQILLSFFISRKLGRKPQRKPSILKDAWDRIETLEAMYEWEVSKSRRNKKGKFQIRFLQNRDTEIFEQWRKSNDKRQWEKAVVILENWNLNLEEISSKIERPIGTIRGWIKVYNQRGIKGLEDKRGKRDTSELIEERTLMKNRIIEILHQSPRTFCINRSNWTQSTIATAYEFKYGEKISESMVGRLIKTAGYSLKRVRKVLTSPDPKYKEKVELLLKTLWSLKSDEMLFFLSMNLGHFE